MTQAVLVEIYQGYGMKFDVAMSEIHKAIAEPESPQAQRNTAQNEAASMAALQSMMSGSDFKGPKG